MDLKGPIQEATNLPSGAVFHLCALQVNPHHYRAKYRGKSSGLGETEYAQRLVEKAKELKLSVLAVTDHNHVGGMSTLVSLAKRRGINVFPGFELGSSEGVHVLCLYPPDTEEDVLGRHLGEFGIRDVEPSAELSDKTLSEILRLVRDQGGVSIAAHVTHDKGLLQALEGQARIRVWRDPNLLAVQIPGSVKDLPTDLHRIVTNKDPHYKRNHPAGRDLALAVVNACDVTQPDDLEKASARCWIKMSEVGVEGLRQAFLDPESRIRLISDPQPEEHAELVALAWEGGFLDGAAIHFNPNLNVLVGGRGTGKSTVIESLRYVLNLEPVGQEAGKAHEGIVRHVLKSGTKISLLLRSHRPSKREYLIERTVPNPPVVKDENGVSNLLPEEILPDIEVYGQHEISELAKSGEKLTRLLDRFTEVDHSLGSRKAALRRELEKNRREIIEVQSEMQTIQERLAGLPGLEETLKRFQDAGLEERLREQSLLVREERVVKTIPLRLKPFREALEEIRGELPIDRAFVSPKALQDLPSQEILAEANGVLLDLEKDLEGAAAKLERALDRAEEGFAEIGDRWEGRRQEVQSKYEAILRELQKSRVDGEEFIRVRRQIEELRPLREREGLLQRLDGELVERRRNLLADWEDVKGEEFRCLDRAAKKVRGKLQDRVHVEVTAGANREPLIELLKETKGRTAEAIQQVTTAKDFSLPKFVECCKAGSQSLHEEYQIPLAQGERLAKAPPDVLMRMEEIELPAVTEIKLNTASAQEPANWQKLEDLSTGQKATAVLLLLLLESEAPLIIDQPEDDLDNRFITEGVVPRMREEKRQRQFVFSTHNANIPVLGDAELILGLSASGEAGQGKARIPRKHMGSIDAKPVRELVEEILEGGKDAFERRRLKYGF